MGARYLILLCASNKGAVSGFIDIKNIENLWESKMATYC